MNCVPHIEILIVTDDVIGWYGKIVESLGVSPKIVRFGNSKHYEMDYDILSFTVTSFYEIECGQSWSCVILDKHIPLELLNDVLCKTARASLLKTDNYYAEILE